MTQQANVRASIEIVRTATPDGGQSRIEQSLIMSADLANGTTDGKADLAWIDNARSIASNTAADIELDALTALDGAVAFAEVCTLAIENPATNSTNLTIGNSGNGAWTGPFGATGTVVLKPGDFCLFHSKTGWGVTNTTGDKLKVANASGATNLFNIGILGRSV